MNLTDTEKGYLAGIIDGEGCVGYYARYTKKVPYHSATIQVTMTDPRALNKIMKMTGYGNISFSAKSGNRKNVWSWQLCNRPQVEEVLTAIRPYLMVKGEQVDIIFGIWEAEKQFPKGKLTPELIELRQVAADKVRFLKQTSLEGVETRRAQPTIQ